MTDILALFLPLGLVLLMFVVGLRLSFAHVAKAFLHPKALVTGLVVQVILLPATAFLLARLFALSEPMTVGLVLVAAAPGGVTSNYIAYLARADVALSAAMTLVTTAMCAITIPLVLVLTGLTELPGIAGLTRMSLLMIGVALVPMVAGMMFVNWRPEWAKLIALVLEPTSKVVFVVIVMATFVQNWQPMMAHFSSVGPAVIGLNMAALALAGGGGLLLGLGIKCRRAIMVEASLQNVAVAMFVAGSLLQNPALAIPALIYALVMNISALLQIGLAQNRRLPATGV